MNIPQCIVLKFPDTLSQWWHIRFLLCISGNSSEKLHCGNVVIMPDASMISVLHKVVPVSTLLQLYNCTSISLPAYITSSSIHFICCELPSQWLERYHLELDNWKSQRVFHDALFWNSQAHLHSIKYFKWVFLGIPVMNCIMGMLLSCPIEGR